MWLFVRDGFFSVVAHREKPGVYLIRARAHKDLVAMQNRLGLTVPIKGTPHADYAFRMELPGEHFDRYLQCSCADVDYDNFKDAVHAVDPARSHAYMGVWTAIRRAFGVA